MNKPLQANIQLARTFQRHKPRQNSGSRVKVYSLHPLEYIKQGYKPIPLPECLRELKQRGVMHGVSAQGTFWFDHLRMCLTPGLLASLYFYFPNTIPDEFRDDNDEPTDFDPF